MKTLDVIVNEGYASWLIDATGRDYETISFTVSNVIAEKQATGIDFHPIIKELQSIDIDDTTELSDYLNMQSMHDADALFMVGKSMGGAKNYTFCESYAPIIKRYKKAAIMFLDAHGRPHERWFKIGWGWLGISAKLKIKPDWKSENIRFYNLYQRGHSPKGAQMINGDVEILLNQPGITHFNIEESAACRSMVSQALDFLLL
jgi:hypothetical protein